MENFYEYTKSITNSANIIQNMATENDIKINVENSNATSTNNKSLSGLNSLASYNLAGVKKTVQFGNLKIEPIRSEKEFDTVMDSFKRNDDSKKIFEHCFSLRDSSDKYLKSLQAYWGENDISKYINRYLATGKFEPEMKVGIFPSMVVKTLNNKDLHNYVRVMEYSLRRLDGRIPEYEGVVYRSGYFNENGGQFFSSSKYADGAVEHASGQDESNFPITFSIIKAKKAYDIEAINRNTRFAGEKEVLLPPNSKYEDITDKIPKEELNGYYAEIRESILKILKENFGFEDVRRAEALIGSLRVYNQIN